MQSPSRSYCPGFTACILAALFSIFSIGCSSAPRPQQSPDVVLLPPTPVKQAKPKPNPASPPPKHEHAHIPGDMVTPPAPASVQQNGDQEATWFGQLKQGRLQYTVPSLMQWKVPSTVTVQISGEVASKAPDLENQTGEATVKVARRMKVLISAPDSPNEFIIAPEPDTQLEQYVPEDGPTTWNFSVTPRYTTSAAKIVVRAWVIYDANTQRELPVYQKAVTVKVPSLGECLKFLIEGDPDYWLKYGLPGGGGFIFLTGLVVGIRKWLASRRNPNPKT